VCGATSGCAFVNGACTASPIICQPPDPCASASDQQTCEAHTQCKWTVIQVNATDGSASNTSYFCELANSP
jgi:hypothetical protein